jgi:hypothetical protein
VSALVHLAAAPIRAGDVIRQRCAWCGALIEERDLSRTAVALEPGETPEDAERHFIDADGNPTTRWDGLVAVDRGDDGGAALWAVDDPADGKIPPDSCMALDAAVTS